MAHCCGTSSDITNLREEMLSFFLNHKTRVEEVVEEHLTALVINHDGSKDYTLPVEQVYDLIREIIPTYNIPEDEIPDISRSLTYIGNNVVKYIVDYFYRKNLQNKWMKVYPDVELAAYMNIGPMWICKMNKPLEHIDLQIDGNDVIIDDALADVESSLTNSCTDYRDPYGFDINWFVRIDDCALFMKVFELMVSDGSTRQISFVDLLRGHLLSVLIAKSIRECIICRKDGKLNDGYFWNKREFTLQMEKDNFLDAHLSFVECTPDAINEEA